MTNGQDRLVDRWHASTGVGVIHADECEKSFYLVQFVHRYPG